MPIIFAVEGTFAREPWGLLGDVIDRIPLEAHRIEYPEQFGTAFSYEESIYIGRRALRRKIGRATEPYFIVGYSQGAHIAGDVALEVKDDPNFIAIYLISDPKRSSKDKVIGKDPGGCGIFGPRPIGAKALHFAAPGDFITANTNAFISNVARYTIGRKHKSYREWFSTFKEAARNRLPGGSLKKAIFEVRHYLTTQVHTEYHNYVVEDGLTATQWIAADIIRRLNESYAPN